MRYGTLHAGERLSCAHPVHSLHQTTYTILIAFCCDGQRSLNTRLARGHACLRSRAPTCSQADGLKTIARNYSAISILFARFWGIVAPLPNVETVR